MPKNSATLILLFICYFTNSNGTAICKLKTANCFSYPNQNIISFKYCRLQPTTKYADIYASLKQTVNTAKVTLNLFRLANGWHPFLLNFTVDFCKFLKNPKANSVTNFFYQTFRPYTNINHSCPYNHDFVLEKFRITAENMKLPYPSGEYGILIKWILNSKPSVLLNFTCIRSVDGYTT